MLVTKRILVTGATGFIGRHLLPRLCRVHEVTAHLHQTDPPPEIAELPVRWQQGDLHHKDLGGHDLMIHLAAGPASSPLARQRVDIELTRALLGGCRRDEVADFIYLSSLEAVDRRTPRADHEREAERLVRDSELQWTILRPSTIYGPGTSQPLSRAIRSVARGLPVPLVGSGRQTIQPLLVYDLARLLTQLAGAPRQLCRTYAVAGGDLLTYRELLEQVASAAHRPLRALRLPSNLIAAASRLDRTGWLRRALDRGQLDRRSISRRESDALAAARRDLGFEPTPLSDGLRQMLAEEGLLG